MNLILTSVFLGSMIVTSYRSVPNQTDSSPYLTSIGERVGRDGVAVSQDWLLTGKIKYGDWVYIEEIGFKKVNDTMNARFSKRMDVWVTNYAEEKEFDKKFKRKKLKVWLIKGKQNENH